MEKDLIKFYENVDFINKDIVKYEDEKGNMLLLPTGQLICSVEYAELTDEELKIGIFEKKVDKNQVLEKGKKITQVDKSTVTKNKKDQGTIIDQEVEINKVWFVKSAVGLTKSFNNKEEALKIANEYNSKILEYINENNK